MTRRPDAASTLDTLRAIVAAPTAPYHEWRAIDAIAAELARDGIKTSRDEYGQPHARLARGAAPPVVLVAHTDHPAFEVVSARGREGDVRILGRFRGNGLDDPVAVQLYDDDAAGPFPATLDRVVPDADLVHNSPGRMRIRAEVPLAVGQWAVLDLPGIAVAGDELRMRAADALPGCALILCALREVAREPFPVAPRAVFT